jgi:predicted Zn-dependent peptidase
MDFLSCNPSNIDFIKLCRKPSDQLLNAIDAVTLKDVAAFVEKIISSPLTMASHGNGEPVFLHI